MSHIAASVTLLFALDSKIAHISTGQQQQQRFNFTNMAAAATAAVNGGVNSSTTTTAASQSTLPGHNPRSYSLSQQPTFPDTSLKQSLFQQQQQQYPHMQHQYNHLQQQQQQPHEGAMHGHAASPSSGDHVQTTLLSSSSSASSAHLVNASSTGSSSSFPTGVGGPRLAAGAAPQAGHAGLSINTSYTTGNSSNDHPRTSSSNSMMNDNAAAGPSSSSSMGSNAAGGPALLSLPTNGSGTSHNSNYQAQPQHNNALSSSSLSANMSNINNNNAQPAFVNRTASPLSYALQNFPPSSSSSNTSMSASNSAAGPGPQASTSTSTAYPSNHTSMPSFQSQSQQPHHPTSGLGHANGTTSGQTFAEKVELFSSVSVSDHRHLFHAYIYDYLFRQGYERTARAFLLDAPNVPTKKDKNADRKGKRKADHQNGDVSTSTAPNMQKSGSAASASRNKRKRSENEELDLSGTQEDDDENVQNDLVQNGSGSAGGSGSRPKKRPTSMTNLSSSNMPISLLEEDEDDPATNVEGSTLTGRSRNDSGQELTKPSTSSSDDSVSTASSHFFSSNGGIIGGSSMKDSSSNASNSTQATSVSTTTSTGVQSVESHTATKGSEEGDDAGRDDNTNIGDDNDTTMNSVNSPMGSRDNLFSPTLFSPTLPNQSPDKSEVMKDVIAEDFAAGPKASAKQEDEDEELPFPDIQIESNWGFLYEWWEVFWDVWRAKGAKGAGSLAAKAYERTLHAFVSFWSPTGRLHFR